MKQPTTKHMKKSKKPIIKLIAVKKPVINTNPPVQRYIDDIIKPGATVFIRATTFHYAGVVESFRMGFVVLKKAAWIACSGRFSQAVQTGKFRVVEPYAKDQLVAINWEHIVDCCQIPPTDFVQTPPIPEK